MRWLNKFLITLLNSQIPRINLKEPLIDEELLPAIFKLFVSFRILLLFAVVSLVISKNYSEQAQKDLEEKQEIFNEEEDALVKKLAAIRNGLKKAKKMHLLKTLQQGQRSAFLSHYLLRCSLALFIRLNTCRARGVDGYARRETICCRKSTETPLSSKIAISKMGMLPAPVAIEQKGEEEEDSNDEVNERMNGLTVAGAVAGAVSSSPPLSPNSEREYLTKFISDMGQFGQTPPHSAQLASSFFAVPQYPTPPPSPSSGVPQSFFVHPEVLNISLSPRSPSTIVPSSASGLPPPGPSVPSLTPLIREQKQTNKNDDMDF